MDHFNGLTPAEAERLALLAEECGEVVQVIGKILRHGYDSRHPDNMDGPDNRALLEQEVGDLSAAVSIAMERGDIQYSKVTKAHRSKLRRIEKYFHHQDD